ncbi:MAG: hypothetical protein PHF64_10830, partial [Methanoregula sp.]|nr:hypothetical protein [Methanoregula sp.]
MPAAIASKTFTSALWRSWIQPQGPNTAMLFAGCWRITGAPTRPKGDVTLLRCPSPVEAKAYEVIGKITGTPGNPTMQITAPLDVVNWLLSINCDFNYQHRYAECGTPNDPGAWEYMLHFVNCRITQDSINGLDTG